MSSSVLDNRRARVEVRVSSSGSQHSSTSTSTTSMRPSVREATSHLVSFCNPNYELSDHLNSNVVNSHFETLESDNSILEELKHEFLYDNTKSTESMDNTQLEHGQQRRSYSHLDATSMGVAMAPGPSSPGPSSPSTSSSVVMRVKKASGCNLPPGWERHSDAEGDYFWHVASGTIQREAPATSDMSKTLLVEKETCDYEDDVDEAEQRRRHDLLGHVRKSCTVDSIADLLSSAAKMGDGSNKRQSLPPPDDTLINSKVAVRSLGWVELDDADLASAERSSKSVNRCILQLANASVVEGQKMWLQLDETALKLLHDANEPSVVIQQQPIHSIRVWGVGRDHGGRDFAYVARDRFTGKHLCHVFRCEHISARLLANALRDMCKRILIDRGAHQTLCTNKASKTRNNEVMGNTKSKTNKLARPNSLNASNNSNNLVGNSKTTVSNSKTVMSRLSNTEGFPTPLEEPKKRIEALYVGSLTVSEASGMRVVRCAITELTSRIPRSDWHRVEVLVAPSTINATSVDSGAEEVLMECRVRFLSFLGIGQDARQCAFIVHTAQDLFVAHVFQCESSAGDLCRAIEAACKLRYQKCLDARPGDMRTANSNEERKENDELGMNNLDNYVNSYTASFGNALKRFVLRNVKNTNQGGPS